MEITFEKRMSVTITVARALSLISIVCAHILFTVDTPAVLDKVYSVLGSIGVICYLFSSAYYYNPQKYGFVGLLKNKALTLCVPWLFLGTVSYLYNALLSKNFGIVGYCKWIIGNGSFLYFMSVLVICFLLFYRTNNIILFSAIGINLVSLVLTATGIIEPLINILHITNYLNVFNWIGVFALGMLAKQLSAEKLYSFLKNTRYIALALFVVAVVLVCVFEVQTGYFSYVGIWLELLGMWAILGASTFGYLENRLVFDVSNLSFAIYLIHMMVIGVFDRLYNIHLVTQIFAVFIVIAISYVALFVVRWVIKLVRLEKYLYPLFGFRDRKMEKR